MSIIEKCKLELQKGFNCTFVIIFIEKEITQPSQKLDWVKCYRYYS